MTMINSSPKSCMPASAGEISNALNLDILQSIPLLIEGMPESERSRSVSPPSSKVALVGEMHLRCYTPGIDSSSSHEERIYHDQPSSLQDARDLNKLDPRERERLAGILHRVSAANEQGREAAPKDMEHYQLFVQQFTITYIQCISKALELHRNLTAVFGSDYAISYDNGFVTGPYEQLKTVLRLAKKNFEGIMSLPKTREQCLQVTHLLQIMSVGKSQGDLPPFPSTSTCFFVKELEEAERPFEALQGLKEGKSVFGAQIDQIVQKLNLPKISPFNILYYAFNEFHRNVIEKQNVTLKLQNGVQLWPCEGENTLEQFFQVFRTHYIGLMKGGLNGQAIRSMIEGKKNLFAKAAASLLNIPSGDKEQPLFPRQILEFLFYTLDEGVREVILKGTTLSENELEEIVQVGKMSKIEAESALRLKFLELTVLLPAFDDPYVHCKMNKMMEQYVLRSKGGKKQLSPIETVASEHIHIFDRKFNLVQVYKYQDLYVPTDVAKEIFIIEDIGGKIKVGSIRSTLLISRPKQKDLTQGRLFDRLAFDWRIAEPLATFIIGMVDKSIIQNFSSHRTYFFMDQLEKIASICEGYELSFDENGAVSVFYPTSLNPLNWFTYSYTKEEYLKIISKLISLFSEGKKALEQYIKILKAASEDPVEELSQLISKRKVLLAARQGLVQYQLNLSRILGDKAELSFAPLFSLIDNEIDPFLKVEGYIEPFMPLPEQGWLRWMASGAWQSNNPKDFAWKIERYQVVLRQLRSEITRLIYVCFGKEEGEKFLINCLKGNYKTGSKKLIQDLVVHLFTIDLDVRSEQYTQRYHEKVRHGFRSDFIQYLRFILYDSGIAENMEAEASNPFYLSSYLWSSAANSPVEVSSSPETNPFGSEADHHGLEVETLNLTTDILTCSEEERFAGQVRQFVSLLCEFEFTNIDLRNESLELLRKFIAIGSEQLGIHPSIENESNETSLLTANFNRIYECFKRAPQSVKAPRQDILANSAIGRWNVRFQPIKQGNIPQVLGSFGISKKGCSVTEEKNVIFFAMGSPTNQDDYGRAVLIPEFLGFKESYKMQGKKHLFIVNQDYRPYTGSSILGGDETGRIDAILKGADETFFIVILSKDSAFYYQSYSEAQDADLSLADVFMDRLIHEHFHADPKVSGNFIPQTVRDTIPDLIETSMRAAESIHKCLFDERKVLSIEERQRFIDVFHIYLTLIQIAQLGTDSVNAGCKDAIDRAIAFILIVVAYIAIINDKHQDSDFRESFEALAFARAMMVRKRPIIKARLDRAEKTIRFLETQAENLKKLHEELFSNYHFSVDISGPIKGK